MLTENQVKEHLALAYVYAVATRAACSFEVPRVDMDSVDAKLTLRNDDDGSAARRSPEISMQVKAHTPTDVTEDRIAFVLKRKNQHDLVKRTHVPRLLVVVVLPNDAERWLSLDEDELILRRCGYWLNLLGDPPTTNETSVTVHLPRLQRFDPDALRRFMRQAARQERL